MRTFPIHNRQPEEKRPFLFSDNSWGYDMSNGWKQRLSWGEKLNIKGAVKQTNIDVTFSEQTT